MSKLVFDDGKIRVFHQDCNEAMAGMPDKAFSLALVDPPYGKSMANYDRPNVKTTKFTPGKLWDSDKPTSDYIAELMRVSSEQIIWGFNHFLEVLPSSNGFVAWFKHQNGNFSECELAWCSTGKGRFYDRSYQKDQYNKIHPTQKPVALYKWLLDNYANPGDTILDTHMGSGSILLACHDLGFSIDAYERDEEYCTAAVERLKRHQSQQRLFLPAVDLTPAPVGAQTQLQL